MHGVLWRTRHITIVAILIQWDEIMARVYCSLACITYRDLERNNLGVLNHTCIFLSVTAFEFYFAFSPTCIVNEDFPPFIFSKTLADKLSTWFAFHSRHLFLFNIGNFAKIRLCWTRKSHRKSLLWSNAMIHEPIVGRSSGFPSLNQSRYANSHTWLVSCWHNKESFQFWRH